MRLTTRKALIIILIMLLPWWATASWTPITSGGGSVSVGGPIGGGTDTRVLFDDGGNLGEDAGMTYAKASDALTTVGFMKSAYFVDASADPADAGALRLGNNVNIAWEKAATGTDWTLGVNASDQLATNAPIVTTSYIRTDTGTADNTTGLGCDNGVPCVSAEASPAGTDGTWTYDSAELWSSNSPINLPVASVAAPSITLGSDTNSGLFGSAETYWLFSVNGVSKFAFHFAPFFSITSDSYYGISSSTADPTIPDTRLFRDGAAASWAMTNAASATPTAYTLRIGSSSRGGTDSDVAGANGTIKSGNGTGLAAPSSITLQVPKSGATGTTAQTYIPAFRVGGAPYAMPDATATGVATVDLPTADTYCASHFSFMYGATDGTDTVSHMGIMTCAFTNDDTVVTGTCADAAETINGTGCGAACDAFTVTVVGTVATVKMNFNNTLSVTGSVNLGLLNNTCGSFTWL